MKSEQNINELLLEHITLMTGHTVTHRIDTIDKYALKACHSLLPAGGPIPHCAPYRVEIDGPIFTIFRAKEPLVTCGIGIGSAKEHLHIWEDLIRISTLWGNVAVTNPPSGQWLAVSILPAVLNQPVSEVRWFGDFELCLAAAIIQERFKHLPFSPTS